MLAGAGPAGWVRPAGPTSDLVSGAGQWLFMLGSLALASSKVSAGGRSRSLLAILAVPVLILFIPIFDTTFVTVMRKLFGRSATQGGRDHTSHRLVALGISERKAVLLLYAMATVSGAIALLSRRMDSDLGLGLIAAFAIIMAIVGLFLAGVTVYKEGEVERAARQPIVAFLIDLSYKRRIFEVLLDVVLIIGAYALAYRLHFGPPDTGVDWQQFRATLPLVIGTKILALLVLGAYRGLCLCRNEGGSKLQGHSPCHGAYAAGKGGIAGLRSR